MKDILKKITIKKIIILIILIFIIFEIINISIDIYNFRQLSIIKTKLNNTTNGKYEFNNYLDFNEKYNTDIRPIKNCYYLSSSNGNEPYIFGFKLYSVILSFIYNSNYYAYPKYDLPVKEMCTGKCFDYSFDNFERIILTSCRGYISGYVYDDINNNGIKDNGEKGIKGIKIDGGGLISYTDIDGYYSLNDLREDWEYEIKPQGLKNKYIRTIKLKKGEIVRNINFGIIKE